MLFPLRQKVRTHAPRALKGPHTVYQVPGMNAHDNTHTLGRISKVLSSRMGKVQTSSDTSMESSRRDISKVTIFVVRAPLSLEKLSSEIRPIGCVILGVARQMDTRYAWYYVISNCCDVALRWRQRDWRSSAPLATAAWGRFDRPVHPRY